MCSSSMSLRLLTKLITTALIRSLSSRRVFVIEPPEVWGVSARNVRFKGSYPHVPRAGNYVGVSIINIAYCL